MSSLNSREAGRIKVHAQSKATDHGWMDKHRFWLCTQHITALFESKAPPIASNNMFGSEKQIKNWGQNGPNLSRGPTLGICQQVVWLDIAMNIAQP